MRSNAGMANRQGDVDLYREIIAVCSQIHTEHINTLCGQNVGLLNVKLAVHIVTRVCSLGQRTSYLRNKNQQDALFNFNLFQ
jgi:hypothetical protein